MGSRIFWSVIFGFLGGVLVRSFFLFGFSVVGFLLLLAGAFILLAFFNRSKVQSYALIAVALCSCALGIARMNIASVTGDPILTERIGTHVVIAGVVSQESDARDTSTLVSIDVASLMMGSTSVRVHAGVLATLPAHTKISYGDRVEIAGQLQLPQPFDTGGGRQFDYPQYLAAQGIEYQLGFATIIRTQGNVGNPLKTFAITVKETFLRGINDVMSEPEGALAGGITVGDKRSIGPQLTQDFQRDSLVHMIVLSGYNITVILNALARMLSWAPRTMQFGGSIFAVIFFILMSGGASSAARSGIMALIAVFARATHRVYLGERALAFVAFAMVIWNPWTLAFDASFQLSALATLGLILWTPLFARLFAHVPERFGIREILASTCATQFMVLPFLLYQNGTLSLVALPANVLALLPVPWAMFFSLIAGMGGMLFGSAATIVAIPAYLLLWYVISVAHFFASLPFAAVTIPKFSAWWMFAAYALMFSGLWFYQKKSSVTENEESST